MIKIYKEKINGLSVDVITITNELGFEVKLMNLGACIIDIKSPDKSGCIESVLVAPIDVSDFYQNEAYYGKTVGRTAGRIKNAHFTLNDIDYFLDKNDGNNCLHGGNDAISEKLFDTKIHEESNKCFVEFIYLSKDLENGFPGNLNIVVTYIISYETNDLKIVYMAETDKHTLCNLTNHAYFNLSGNSKRNVLDHTLIIKASKYTKLDEEILTVSIDTVNDVMDFRYPKKIGKDIFDETLKAHACFGYDHCYIFDDTKNQIVLEDEISKRRLEISTTYPGVVLYSCNYPHGETISSGQKIGLHQSVCLECQYIPNGINMDVEEKGILLPGQRYYNEILFSFKVS